MCELEMEPDPFGGRRSCLEGINPFFSPDTPKGYRSPCLEAGNMIFQLSCNQGRLCCCCAPDGGIPVVVRICIETPRISLLCGDEALGGQQVIQRRNRGTEWRGHLTCLNS